MAYDRGVCVGLGHCVSVGVCHRGCTDACDTNSFGVRGALAGGKSVVATGVSEGALAWAEVASLAKGLYSAYVGTRSSLNSPDLALGTANGTYIEVVSCRCVGADAVVPAAVGQASALAMCSHVPARSLCLCLFACVVCLT